MLLHTILYKMFIILSVCLIIDDNIVHFLFIDNINIIEFINHYSTFFVSVFRIKYFL